MLLKFSHSPLSRSQKCDRALQLSLVSSPLLGAYFFSHTDLSSPFFCPLRTLTGIPCPGCGLTRSFVAIAQGHLYEAASFHILGIVFFLLLAFCAVYLTLELGVGRSLKIPFLRLFRRQKPPLLASLGIFLLSYHSVRLIYLWQSHQLLPAILQSPLMDLFRT